MALSLQFFEIKAVKTEIVKLTAFRMDLIYKSAEEFLSKEIIIACKISSIFCKIIEIAVSFLKNLLLKIAIVAFKNLFIDLF